MIGSFLHALYYADFLTKILLLLSLIIPLVAFSSAIFMLIMGLKSMLNKPACAICKMETKDLLLEDGFYRSFCRRHLVERYAEKFLKNTFQVVMVEPFAEKKNSAEFYGYAYYPLDEMKNIFFTKEEEDVLKTMLQKISDNKCSECISSSNILYVDEKYAVWKKHGQTSKFSPREDIVPNEIYLSKGSFLCNTHALDRLKGRIENFPKAFEYEGLSLPYGSDGFQAIIID